MTTREMVKNIKKIQKIANGLGDDVLDIIDVIPTYDEYFEKEYLAINDDDFNEISGNPITEMMVRLVFVLVHYPDKFESFYNLSRDIFERLNDEILKDVDETSFEKGDMKRLIKAMNKAV